MHDKKLSTCTCTWSTWMSIIKALRLHEASCSCSRKVWTNSGASGIRKSKFLRTKQVVKMSLQVMVHKNISSTRHVFVSIWNSSFLDKSLRIEDSYTVQARTTKSCKWAMQTRVHSCSHVSTAVCLSIDSVYVGGASGKKRFVFCYSLWQLCFVGQCCKKIIWRSLIVIHFKHKSQTLY